MFTSLSLFLLPPPHFAEFWNITCIVLGFLPDLKSLFIIYDAFSEHIWQPNPSQVPFYQSLSKQDFRHKYLYKESVLNLKHKFSFSLKYIVQNKIKCTFSNKQ